MRPKSHMARVALLFGILVGAASSQAASLPVPTGPHAVGRRVLRWIDASRAETMSSRPDDKRGVVLWLWYPATAVAGSRPAPYIDDIDQLANALSGDEVSLARSVQSHAVSGAPPAAEPKQFPLILFSPGSGAIPALYSSFAEELASHGYLIAAVDHPYDDEAVLLADGRLVKQAKQPNGGEALLRFERQRVSVRVQDLRFALDQLTRMQNGEVPDALKGRIDLSRVGAFGHSVGGMTAAELCMMESRVLACGNLDGVVAAMPAYPDPAGHGPQQAFLFMEKPLSAMPREAPEDARRRLAFLREKGNALLAAVSSGYSYRVTITGATHATFSDEEILTSGTARRQGELLDFARGYLRAFFDKNIKNRDTTLLDTPPLDNAIRIQAFSPR